MNVRITPRGWPNRTDLYGGVDRILSDGALLTLCGRGTDLPPNWCHDIALPLAGISEIALDDEPAALA